MTGGLVAAMFVLYLWWDGPGDDDRRPSTELQYLDAGWSFKDSWVTNVTDAGGVLTGIFGSSDTVTAILGEDAESAVALATVGAAVAIAFVSAGPIVLTATKKKGKLLVWGFLAAAAVTLTGAGGELWIVYRSG